MQIPQMFLIFISFLFITSLAGADQLCSMNGKVINVNDGSATAGLTGIMKCTDSATGQLRREQEYRNGKEVGHQMMIDSQDQKVVSTLNDKGNAEGATKIYDPNGKLIAQENYHDGKKAGLNRRFYPSGKTQDIEWYDNENVVFSASYTESSKLTELICPAKSFSSGDRELCGFAGHISKVDLFNSEGKLSASVAYLNGKLADRAVMDEKGKVTKRERIDGNQKVKTEFYPNGKVKIEAHYKDKVLDGEEKEYNAEGTLIRRTEWDEGQIKREEAFYENGKTRSQSVREKRGDKKWQVARKIYWDSGKLASEAVYMEHLKESRWYDFSIARWIYSEPIGELREYYENGTIRLIETYNDEGDKDGLQKTFAPNGKLIVEDKYTAGKLKSRKIWDKDTGKLTTDEEYFDDGSRKLKKTKSTT